MPSKRSRATTKPKADRRVGIVVQARMGSTRLPGKVLRTVAGKPLLEILLRRIAKAKSCDVIVIATTKDPKDDPIEELCKRMGVAVFRGSEQDVLARYYLAAKENGLKVVVRITGDCPLMDPEVVDRLIDVFIELGPKVDYLSNTHERTYPRGLDIEVFSFDALELAYKEAKQQYEREHVTPFIWENKKRFRLANLEWERNAQEVRLTVDTQEDLDLIIAINGALVKKGIDIVKASLKDIMCILDDDPSLLKINAHIEQKSHRTTEPLKGSGK